MSYTSLVLSGLKVKETALGKITQQRGPPWLSACHPVVLSSILKHTIYAFSGYSQFFTYTCPVERDENKQEDVRIGAYL